MIRFIRNIALFLPFLLIFYIISIIFIGLFFPKSLQLNINYNLGYSGHLHSKIQDLKSLESTDILFLGSSHCYRGFDVRIFEKAGFSAFNLGSSSQSHLQTNILLKRYLDQIQPKKIVYEVYPEMFETDGIESTLDLMANDSNYDYLWKLVLQQNHLKVYNSFIYGAFRMFFELDKDYKEAILKGKDQYIKGGFVERKSSGYNSYFKQPSSGIQYKKNQIIAFKKNIELIKERNIELILVQTPVTQSYFKTTIDPEKHDSFMTQFGSYYNFNGKINLIDSLHFYDYHHLNQAGVELFNEEFIKQVLLE